MKPLIISILFISFFSVPAFAQKSNIIFTDDFQSYHNGSDGSPTWTISKGFWQIVDGKFVQKTREYDCGAMLNLFVNYSFEMSFDFRVIEGDPGAGFFFHSEELKTTDFSHMSRFESNKTMLIGHFMNAGYECTHSARFDQRDFSKWHRLVLHVDQDKKKYDIYLDNFAISQGEPLLFPTGFVGIQSSGGIFEFDNVMLKQLPMKTKTVAMSWLHHFLVTDNNMLIVPDKSRGIVQQLDRDGNLINSFGIPVSQKGQLLQPTSIAQLSNGDFIVGDVGLHRINLFDKKGNWKNSAGYFGTGAEQLNLPADIDVDENDNIFVADEGNNRVQVWDRDLKVFTEFGKKELDHPVAVAVKNEKIFVVNNGMHQVEIYSWKNSKAAWQSDFNFGGGVGREILIINEKIYLSVGNEIRRYNQQGEFLNAFTGNSISGIFPYGLAADNEGQIYAADFRTGKIFILDQELSDPEPKVTFPSQTQTEVKLVTPKETAVAFRITRKDGIVYNVASGRNTEHLFQIDGLRPSTTYHVEFSPTIRTIPPSPGFSKKYAFITPAESGKKHYWSLPMATIIFINVLDSSKVKPGYSELPPLAQEELDRIKSQIEDGIRFYWMNSGMNLFLDNDYIIVDEKLFHHQIFGSQWWYPPKEEWVARVIEQSGKKVSDYVSVLFLACVRDFNVKTSKYEMRGRGGGFTAGIGANSQYGLSYWEVTHANHGSGNNWLMGHEFHHQLDELFLVSGYPEYWFNHFSPTVNTAADFGEHFDGNAWILKNWQTANWYDLKFGEVRFAADADRDGIPDDDPSLPMDEVRLKSNPNSIDSDNDGVSDLDEIQFSNWIVEGCGETYGGSSLLPNLMNPDTDGDGLNDGIDPYPLYPFEPKITYEAKGFDEIPHKIEFARLLDQRIHAVVFAQWDSANLSFQFKMDRLAPIKLMIDADADGWFIGRDNYLIYLRPKDATSLETELVMVNCSDPKRWPFHDLELAKKIKIDSSIEFKNGEYVVSVSIPKDDFTGIELANGEKIGINIGFSVAMDAEGHQRYLTIFEPNRFFDVKLVE
ncbi:NHL repeat-containing protein [candidate division KSB1 bacterium]|nr:NHL repeat-containing protein [candidate division KSB1 bacterium]